MNNYCGFIEVYGNGINTYYFNEPIPYYMLKHALDETPNYNFHTVAIFKIKLK